MFTLFDRSLSDKRTNEYLHSNGYVKCKGGVQCVLCHITLTKSDTMNIYGHMAQHRMECKFNFDPVEGF